VPLTTLRTCDDTVPSTTTANWLGLPSIRKVAPVPWNRAIIALPDQPKEGRVASVKSNRPSRRTAAAPLSVVSVAPSGAGEVSGVVPPSGGTEEPPVLDAPPVPGLPPVPCLPPVLDAPPVPGPPPVRDAPPVPDLPPVPGPPPVLDEPPVPGLPPVL
jgi:type VI secretion system secreted protein VgrG